MAKTPSSNTRGRGASRFSDPIDIFRQQHNSTIDRLLKRAEDRSRSQGEANQAQMERLARSIGRKGALTKLLDKALYSQGRTVKNRQSIRMKAPDTQGRPFHFSYTHITKQERKSGDRGSSSASQEQKNLSERSESVQKQQATTHQSYIERKNALAAELAEADPSKTIDQIEMEVREQMRQERADRGGELLPDDSGLTPEMELALERSSDPFKNMAASKTKTSPEQENDEKQAEPETPEELALRMLSPGMKRHLLSGRIKSVTDLVSKALQDDRAPETAPTATASYMQQYIENLSKTPNLYGTPSSFGSIGDTPEERQNFWDKLEETEKKGATVQYRLVLELPHEATPEARFLMAKDFGEFFRKQNLPYWIALHDPDSKNDQRNFHAHLVFSDRPASKMVNPATGETVWDFEIKESYKNSSRHTKTTRPYRQNKIRDFRGNDSGFIKRLRKHFSQTVNRVLVEHDGLPPLYDPRSYKDMGLAITPMQSVSRRVADKTGSQKFLVMDEEWTRRQISKEIELAAQRRTDTFVALEKTEAALIRIARNRIRRITTIARTPYASRPTDRSIISTEYHERVAEEEIKIERERLSKQMANESTIAALKNIITVTQTSDQPKRGRPKKPTQLEIETDEGLQILHNAAKEELAYVIAKIESEKKLQEKTDRTRLSRIKRTTRAIASGFFTPAQEPEKQTPKKETQRTKEPEQKQPEPRQKLTSEQKKAIEDQKRRERMLDIGVTPEYRQTHRNNTQTAFMENLSEKEQEFLRNYKLAPEITRSHLNSELESTSRALRSLIDRPFRIPTYDPNFTMSDPTRQKKQNQTKPTEKKNPDTATTDETASTEETDETTPIENNEQKDQPASHKTKHRKKKYDQNKDEAIAKKKRDRRKAVMSRKPKRKGPER